MQTKHFSQKFLQAAKYLRSWCVFIDVYWCACNTGLCLIPYLLFAWTCLIYMCRDVDTFQMVENEPTELILMGNCFSSYSSHCWYLLPVVTWSFHQYFFQTAINIILILHFSAKLILSKINLPQVTGFFFLSVKLSLGCTWVQSRITANPTKGRKGIWNYSFLMRKLRWLLGFWRILNHRDYCI